MVGSATVYAAPPLVAATLSVGVVWVALRHRERPVARTFAVVMAAVALWSLAHAVQLLSVTPARQLFWGRVTTTIGAAVPTLWLVLALQYADRNRWLTRRRGALLSLEPGAAVGLLWTNSLHGLLWSDVSLETSRPLMDVTFEPLFLAHVAYGYTLILLGIALVVEVSLQRASIYRRQAAMLAVGAAVPLAANATLTLGYDPVPGLDLTTVAFTVTGVVWGVALFRFDLLNLTPVAHRSVIDDLGDGLVVLDADGRITDRNENAVHILEADPEPGRHATAVFPVDDLAALDGSVLTVDLAGRSRHYRLRRSPLRDHRGRVAGWAVALRDVTDTKAYEQRLEVANRLLRHNLRNDMNVIMGLAADLSDGLSGRGARRAERIRERAAAVAELGEKARQMETTMRPHESDPVVVDAVGVVDECVRRLRRRYPGASVGVSAPAAAPVRAPDAELLEIAVTNVVENAVEHNDREEPTVEVAVREGGKRVTLEVADDGPGIPEQEHRVLLEGEETPLRHGSGLGLWLVHWVVTAAGGEVSFAENDPRGSVVTLALPAAEVDETREPPQRI